MAARLQHRPAHVVEGGKALEARLGREVVECDAFARQVAFEDVTVIDQDERRAFEQRPQAPHRKFTYDTATVRRPIVESTINVPVTEFALRDALLDEIADHDEQDDVERLQTDSSRLPSARVSTNTKKKMTRARTTRSMMATARP